MIAWALLSVAALSSPNVAGPDPSFALSSDVCGGAPVSMERVLPVSAKPGRTSLNFASEAPFLRREGAAGAPEGILSGKTIYMVAGHGQYWAPGVGWRHQRPNIEGVVEDILSVEAVNEYIIPYLHAMGAYVVPLREADMQPEMHIVDDGDAIVEGGAAASEGPAGWGAVPLPITSIAAAPFSSGSSRTLVATEQPTGGLVYTPAFETSGHYNVYISFVQGADRAPDAHYVVRHSGGETHFRVDQRRHGGTWVLLGNFYFEAGAPASEASVALLTDSGSPGAVISADAVRFGGGMAMFDRGGGTTERPMYEMAARYYTQWNGAPPSVFNVAPTDTEHNNDVDTRPRFVQWDHEDGEDDVYVSWHTNATGNAALAARGTESYTFQSVFAEGTQAEFSGVPGSLELQNAVQDEVVADLRAEWDPAWVDRGKKTKALGELQIVNNSVTPAVLIEIGYHETPEEARQLSDPENRRIASRAIAQGIARYFAEKDGVPVVLPPEPPQAVAVRNDGAGGLQVTWAPPDNGPAGGNEATGYIVQVSHNGHGFDEGTYVTGTSHTLTGLAAGDVRYVRVLAANDGGHSLPSHTVAAALAPSGQGSVLIVGGFDRLDRHLLVAEPLLQFDSGTVNRMWLDRINDGSYAVRHAEAIAAAGISFDGATNDAVEQNLVQLAPYQAVDWFTGEDAISSVPLNSVAQDAVAAYLDAGGRLLLSGAEIGWSLAFQGSPDDQAFFSERLHAQYISDDAETYDVAALPGPLEGMPALSFKDPTIYDAEFPDVYEPVEGAVVALAYQNGVGVGAAVAWGMDSDGERGIMLGFPFETIADPELRTDLMTRTLAFFDVEEPDGPFGGTDGGDEDGDGDDGAGDNGGTGSDDPGTGGGQWTAGGEDVDDAPPGCGCTSGGGGRLGGLLFFVAGVFARRRRSRAR